MAKSKSSTADTRIDALASIVSELLAHASFPTLSTADADALRSRAAELADTPEEVPAA